MNVKIANRFLNKAKHARVFERSQIENIPTIKCCQKMIRDRIKFWVKVIISAVLVVILLWKVDWRDSFIIISNISLIYLALFILISFFMILISCFKWRIFISARNIDIPFIRLFHLYLIGYFFNNFLPSNVGGDLVRGFALGKEIKNYPDSFGSVFLERFTGLLGLCGLAILASLLNSHIIQKPAVCFFLVSLLVALFLTILFLFTERFHMLVEKTLRLTPLRIIRRQICEFLNVVYYFHDQPFILSKAMAISFLFHIMTLVNTLVICMALQIHVAVLDIAVIVPMVLLISMIPISLNGIGVFEGSLVYFFSVIGIGPSASLSIALVFRAKNLLIALMGGAIFTVISKMPQEPLNRQ